MPWLRVILDTWYFSLGNVGTVGSVRRRLLGGRWVDGVEALSVAVKGALA